jgi:hypothetical protein
MNRTPLRVALLALALLLCAPAAHAATAPAIGVPASPAAIGAASAVAATHWARQACGGTVAISWEHLGRGTNAESRWSNPAGGDPSTYSNCAIAFSLDVRWDWPKLCTVTEHELGHLTGHQHSADENDLMSPYYLAPSPECARTVMPGASKSAAAKPAKKSSNRSQTRSARDAARRAARR